MITQQGIQFERQPAKYGTKSTCVLSVPSFRKTPQLDDAKRIVTAAKEGVVLRPVSDRYSAVEMTKSVSPHPDSQGNNRSGVVGLSALPVQTGETSKTTEKSNDEAKAPSVVESTLPPAAPSRYSPSMKRSVSWNSSEQADSVIPNATNHKKESSSPLPVTNSPPQTSSFKTRTSYFSALEVLERNSSQKMSRSKGMGSIDVAVTGTTASDNNNCSTDLGSGHDMHSTINFDEFSDVARFSYFALAAYSTLMFLYMNPCSGGCKLCTYGCCPEAALGTCCGTDSSSPQASHSRQQPSSQGTNTPVGKQVEHDNKCHTNESAMRQMVKAPNTELVYAQFSNDIETRPYAVFLDYEKEALVITVRGTLSLEDCVADAMSEPEPLDVVGMQYGFNGVGRHAHSGFLKSAQWICEDLFKHPQVAFLLSSVAGTNPTGMTMDRDGSMDSSAGSLTNTLGSPLKPRTVSRLVIVGHSLGAGVASLLALLMKRDYPTLHCFGYGAPGSTMDDETAHEAKSYATSVVLGDDMVGSLSFHSLSVLREEVLDSIVRSRCSKMSILQMTMFKECSEELVDELLYAPGQEPTSAFRTMFLKYKAHMKRQRSTFLPCPLFIPGKVVHLRQIGKEKDRSSLIGSVGRVFVPVIEPHRSFFEEIKVSATMITDHLPDLYCSELNAMLHDWAIERHTQQKLLAVHGVATESEKFLSTNDNQV
jgi:sn1-specific diacylglycerol lipase